MLLAPYSTSSLSFLAALYAVWIFAGNLSHAESISEDLYGDWTLMMESEEPAWMSVYEEEGETKVRMRLYVGPEGPYEIDGVVDGRLHFSLKPKRKSKKA